MISYLPIGSVVLLKGAEHRVMVTGRLQMDGKTNAIFDYSGCMFPEGIQNSNEVILFNDDDIDMLFFIGFQDLEELNYKAKLLEIAQERREEIEQSRK